MTLAQRFNAGSKVTTTGSPQGTADVLAKGSAVPSGLVGKNTTHPTLKRWAILESSLREERKNCKIVETNPPATGSRL